MKYAKQHPQCPQKLLHLLNRFYQDYRCLLSLATTANNQLISRLLFTTLPANLPLILVIVGNLLLRSLPLVAILMIVMCSLAQTTRAVSITVFLTSIYSDFYRSDRLLYRIQLTLANYRFEYSTNKTENQNSKLQHQQQWRHFRQSSALLLDKLHLAVFYETVCTEKKFRFTLGPHTKISYRSMFEFLLIYSGSILYVAKMFKSGRL